MFTRIISQSHVFCHSVCALKYGWGCLLCWAADGYEPEYSLSFACQAWFCFCFAKSLGCVHQSGMILASSNGLCCLQQGHAQSHGMSHCGCETVSIACCVVCSVSASRGFLRVSSHNRLERLCSVCLSFLGSVRLLLLGGH